MNTFSLRETEPVFDRIRKDPRARVIRNIVLLLLVFAALRIFIPLNWMTRRRTSSNEYALKLPMCAKLYTVGPQVYSRISPPARGVSSSTRRESEL